MDGLPVLDLAQAEAFAATALANVEREYPHKLDHVMGSDADVQSPRVLHPAFHGSYDWHSCVHMHWLLACVWRAFPDLTWRAEIERVFARHFAPDAIEAECAYLRRPDAQAFERPYGWAWLLKLATELGAGSGGATWRWSEALAPLTAAIVARYVAYVRAAPYPIRYGMHANTAFGLAFAIDFARAMQLSEFEADCVEAARRWFGADRNAPAAWEPSGADFLSPVLVEAELVRRILPDLEFATWLEQFLPGMAAREPSALFVPARVTDRSDPQVVHLDGLNLSRAWCWRRIAAALPAGDGRREIARDAARVHLEAGLDGVARGQYVGTHWLASFAVLALTPASGTESSRAVRIQKP